MKFFIIGDEETVLGFGMAGVQGQIASGPDEADAALKNALDDKTVGIIIITERVAELIRDKVDHFIFSAQFPLIVEIPDRLGKMAEKPGIREMVNKAIGLKF